MHVVTTFRRSGLPFRNFLRRDFKALTLSESAGVDLRTFQREVEGILLQFPRTVQVVPNVPYLA